MEMDLHLTKEETIKELRLIAGFDSTQVAEEIEAEKHEASMLREEAEMPLEELMAKYTDVANSAALVTSLTGVKADGACSSSVDDDAGGDSDDEKADDEKADDSGGKNVIKNGDKNENNASAESNKDSNKSDKCIDENVGGKTEVVNDNNCNLNDGNTTENVGGSSQGGSSSGSKDGSKADGSKAGGSKAGGSKAGGSKVGGSKAGGSKVGGSKAGGSDTGCSDPGGSSSGSGSSSQAGGSSSSQDAEGEAEASAENSKFTPEKSSLQSLIFADENELDDDSEDEEMWENCSDSEEEDEEIEEDDEDSSTPFHSVPFRDLEEPGSESGCTAVVALLTGSRIVVANVGDSRCVLCRAGKAMDLSVDHKPEDDTERTRIENAGGKVTKDGRVNGGLNLSRAIGDHFYKTNKDIEPKDQMISAFPDIEEVTLTDDDDFIILACDGIWNVMSSQEAVNFVKVQVADDPSLFKTPSKICEMMFDFCISPDTTGDGTGCDNMTCIVVFLKDSLPATTNGVAHMSVPSLVMCDDAEVMCDDAGVTCEDSEVTCDSKMKCDSTDITGAAIMCDDDDGKISDNDIRPSIDSAVDDAEIHSTVNKPVACDSTSNNETSQTTCGGKIGDEKTNLPNENESIKISPDQMNDIQKKINNIETRSDDKIDDEKIDGCKDIDDTAAVTESVKNKRNAADVNLSPTHVTDKRAKKN